jgi:hypothetical protein
VDPTDGLEDLKERKISFLTGSETLKIVLDCSESCRTPVTMQDAGQIQIRCIETDYRLQ